MEDKQITSDDLVNVVFGQILSGPDDSFLDDIFDWIQNSIRRIVSAVTNYVRDRIAYATAGMRTFFSNLISPLATAINSVKFSLHDIWGRIRDLMAAIQDIRAGISSIVSSAVTSAITVISSWINSAASTIKSWVTTKVSKVLPWIQSAAATLRDDVFARLVIIRDFLYEHIIANKALLGALQAGIPPLLLANWLKIEVTGTDIMGHEDAGFAGLKTWFTENVTDPITDWFKEWWTDLKARMTGVWNTIITWIKTFFTETIPELAMALWTKMKAAAGWVADTVSGLLSDAFENVLSLLSAIAPITPGGGLGAFTGISKVGIVLAGGLGLMTVAGNLVHPLHSLGLEHVSAMVYDLTNYKMLTGAMIGALAATAIRTPITYYFNSMLRPWLLDRRSFMDLMSRRAFTDPAALQNPDLTATVKALAPAGGRAFENAMIGYFGNPAQYYGFFKELANTPLRYFPLAGIARTGFFEPVWFTEALHRSGYSETAVNALMVMYRKMADEAVRGTMSGAALTRFKEGFTTEEQFHSEMAMLGYSDMQFTTYLAAARIDYATDYLRDLLTAYRDAVRTGRISLDDYRKSLLGLGMVPERVEGYILMERARLKPTEPLTPIAPPTPAYETDAGKIKVDTIRRQRRKMLITRDQEISSLQFLGMDPNLAKAIADNDDIRLAEKAE